jgi:hypothetical protein
MPIVTGTKSQKMKFINNGSRQIISWGTIPLGLEESTKEKNYK